MTIQTYSDLQTAVANWLARSDLAANIPDFIAIFEAVANRRLRVRQQESAATLTPSSGVASLPADYLAWRRVTWTGSTNRELVYGPRGRRCQTGDSVVGRSDVVIGVATATVLPVAVYRGVGAA